MMNQSKKKNVTIQQIIAALLDDKNVFPPAYLRFFSDLEGENLAALRSIWPQVSPKRRFTLLEDLESITENDTLVLFDNLAKLALIDEEPGVRVLAIRLLWESGKTDLAHTFIKMLQEDPSEDVRAAAASVLGQYVYLGELEEIPESLFHKVEEKLLKTAISSDTALVRRRALEALGFSGRKEVPPLIRKAYESNETDWLISSLFAMGRSADDSWAPEVIRMLAHPLSSVQKEAIQAAGELELEAARRPLLHMLNEELYDMDMRNSIFWALSKIGGEEVREILESLLEETENEEEVEIIEEALENLDFTEEMNLLNMMEFDNLPEDIDSIEEYLIRRNTVEFNVDEQGNELREGEDSFEDNTSDDPELSKTKKKRHHHK